ncbi:hypothetical protein D3C78_1878330 [compost metagenome]
MGAEIVDLVGLDLLNDPAQVRGVRQVTEVKTKAKVFLEGILIKMIDPAGIE